MELHRFKQENTSVLDALERATQLTSCLRLKLFDFKRLLIFGQCIGLLCQLVFLVRWINTLRNFHSGIPKQTKHWWRNARTIQNLIKQIMQAFQNTVCCGTPMMFQATSCIVSIKERISFSTVWMSNKHKLTRTNSRDSAKRVQESRDRRRAGAADRLAGQQIKLKA